MYSTDCGTKTKVAFATSKTAKRSSASAGISFHPFRFQIISCCGLGLYFYADIFVPSNLVCQWWRCCNNGCNFALIFHLLKFILKSRFTKVVSKLVWQIVCNSRFREAVIFSSVYICHRDRRKTLLCKSLKRPNKSDMTFGSKPDRWRLNRSHDFQTNND